MISRSLRTFKKLNGVNYSSISEMEPLATNENNLNSIKHHYEEVIKKLNSLQSNAAVISSLTPNKRSQASNIGLTHKYLDRCGIDLGLLEGKVIHVSGTKGKGSTCALVESILLSHNFTTGFYSSPHLFSVTERIRINGKPISQQLFTRYFRHIYNILDNNKEDSHDMPTYFKLLTLMAFKVFISENVDVAIVEVGIGGEFDCTNTLRGTGVVGVTSLGYDHMSVLGNTVEEIAWNKAGIMKQGCLAFTCDDQPPSALQVLRNRAKEKNCELFVIKRDLKWECGERWNKLTNLNYSLAAHLAHAWIFLKTGISPFSPQPPSWESGFDLDEKTKRGLTNCVWPGRFQVLPTDNITYYLDGAHTEESITLCTEWFAETVPSSGKKVLIFNLTGSRNASIFLNHLSKCGFEFACFCPNILNSSSPLDNYICSDIKVVMERCEKHAEKWREITGRDARVFSNICDTLSFLESSQDRQLHVLVTGSLHLVGNVVCQLQPHPWQS